MSSHTAALRSLVAGALILGAGILALVLRPAPTLPAHLPPASALSTPGLVEVAASRVVPEGTGSYRQWQFRDDQGTAVLVYVEATRSPQRVLSWTGQLGYQGEGYQVSELHTTRLGSGWSSVGTLSASGSRLAMAAADLGPAGPQVGGLSAAPQLLRDQLAGEPQLWYLVRVIVPASAGIPPVRILASLVGGLERARA